MIYTLIGSRETPPEILTLMTKFAYKAALQGYTVRSGGAGGADTCAEEGVLQYLKDYNQYSKVAEDLMEIYLPWKDFNSRNSNDYGYYTLPFMSNRFQAEDVAKEIHPKWKLEERIKKGEVEQPKNWKPMSQGAKKLHTRNIYQVLGKDLATPSRFILCYGESEKKGSVIPKGGTRSACVLGQQHNVEIFNLYLEEHLERVKDWVGE